MCENIVIKCIPNSKSFWFTVFFLEYYTSLYFYLKTVFWCNGLCNVQALRTQKLVNKYFSLKKSQ